MFQKLRPRYYDIECLNKEDFVLELNSKVLDKTHTLTEAEITLNDKIHNLVFKINPENEKDYELWQVTVYNESLKNWYT